MARLLGFAETPAQLVDIAGLAAELGAQEAYVLLTAPLEDEAPAIFKKVYVAKDAKTPGQAAQLLEKLYDQHSPDLVVGPATKNGNEALARLAASKDLPMLTEATGIELSGDTAKVKRQVLGGRSTAVYKTSLPVAITIPLRKYQYTGPTGQPETVELEAPQPDIKITGVEEKKREAVNIEEAEIVVGVGRGFKKKEDLQLAEQLAKLLGGVVGCTRPIAADYGWLSEDRWIGISGKKIRPKLYLAIGISGAPQHMAAAMDSKIIVAVNKDKNAPIFEYADYGVVADLYKFIPILIKKLEEKLGKKA